MSDEFRKRRVVWKQMYDKEQLVNVTIKTEDGGVFKVHKELLWCASPYFKQLVFDSISEPMITVSVPGISSGVMSSVINYIYTFKIVLDDDTVELVNDAALSLQLPNLIKLCKKFLEQVLDETNCIKIYNLAKKNGYDDLQEKVKRFIMLNFMKIFPVSDDFLQLQPVDLHDLIQGDELNLPSEDLVFCAVLRWVEFDPVKRKMYLPDLLRCIRFGLCSFQFLQDSVKPHPYLTNNDECQSVLYQASLIHAEIAASPNQAQRNFLDLGHPFVRPRVPSEVIFIVGGWSAGSATNVMETYDVKADRWFLTLAANNMPRAYHGMVALDGHIYIIGGFDGNQCFNSVRRFDPVAHTWTEVACMYVARCYVSVAQLAGCIYALGGYDGQRRSSGGERYDPPTNQWTLIANMQSIRSDASADSLDGKVYIVGGFNGAQVLNTAEVYDPETNSWTLIGQMSTPRSGVKLVAYEEYLYVIGGFNGTNRLSSVERYDTKSRQWFAVPSMQATRSNFATVVMEGSIYAIGGFNGLTTVSSVESYSSQRDVWTPVSDLNLNRSALAACVIRGLPNAQDYSFIGANPVYPL